MLGITIVRIKSPHHENIYLYNRIIISIRPTTIWIDSSSSILHFYLQYVWGQDVDRFLKLGNFASTT